MTYFNYKLFPVALIVLAAGALLGCTYSAAAFATMGGALLAQEMGCARVTHSAGEVLC